MPWQLIARQDADGTPDLVGGLYTDPITKTTTAVGGFKSFDELSGNDKLGNSYWDDIVGDPESYTPPLSPFMRESTVPRMGTDPITGIAISPPTARAGPNPINGHEWSINKPPGDIEYACIFPVAGTPGPCPGFDGTDNPLCDPDPSHPGMMIQTRAKAYPGVKNLAIAKGMKDQGIAASICAKQLHDPRTNPDGTPARRTTWIPPAVQRDHRPPQAGDRGRVPRPGPLTPDPTTGEVPCIVLEGGRDPGGADCNCAGADRADVLEEPTSPAEVVGPAAAAPRGRRQEHGQLHLRDRCQSSGADLHRVRDPAPRARRWALGGAPVRRVVLSWTTSVDPSPAKAETSCRAARTPVAR